MLPAARRGIKDTSAYNAGMGEPERAFVLLRHQTSEGVHWDLMLDTGPSLATWQLDEDPSAQLGKPDAEGITARPLPEHRRDYLEYEGPVSRNRGDVARADRGTYTSLAKEAAAWTFTLAGQRLSGRFRLSADQSEAAEWRFQRLA